MPCSPVVLCAVEVHWLWNEVDLDPHIRSCTHWLFRLILLSEFCHVLDDHPHEKGILMLVYYVKSLVM